MTTATHAWPTLAEIRAITRRVEEAHETVELLGHRLGRMIDHDEMPALRDGVEPPTLADLGTFTCLVEWTDLELSAYKMDVDRFRIFRERVTWEVAENAS